MPRFMSAGELLVGRPLGTETRAGVTHYMPGQMQAEFIVSGHDYFTKEPQGIARLTYVDTMGHACVVLCCRTPDRDWFPTWIARAGQMAQGPDRRVPEGFALSEQMLACIRAVEPQGSRQPSNLDGADRRRRLNMPAVKASRVTPHPPKGEL